MLDMITDVKIAKAKEKKFVPKYPVVAQESANNKYTAWAVMRFLEPTSQNSELTEAIVKVCDKFYDSEEEIAQAVANHELDAPAELISFITLIEQEYSDFLEGPVLVQLESGEYAVALTHDPAYDGVTRSDRKILRILSKERWLDLDSAIEVVTSGNWTNFMEYEIPKMYLSAPKIKIYEDDNGFYFARKFSTLWGDTVDWNGDPCEVLYEATTHRYPTAEVAEQELQKYLQLVKYE